MLTLSHSHSHSHSHCLSHFHSLVLPSTSTSATNREIGRCFQSARPPAAHPVRPSTSMINCWSMHFKNVNLSYMPRSIRLCPKKRKQTDREVVKEQKEPKRNGMNLCMKVFQTGYRNQIKNVYSISEASGGVVEGRGRPDDKDYESVVKIETT